jgi:hypothetical protein
MLGRLVVNKIKELIDKLNVWQLTGLLVLLLSLVVGFAAVFTKTAIVILCVSSILFIAHVIAIELKQGKE